MKLEHTIRLYVYIYSDIYTVNCFRSTLCEAPLGYDTNIFKEDFYQPTSFICQRHLLNICRLRIFLKRPTWRTSVPTVTLC